MVPPPESTAHTDARLERRFNLTQATALNMSNMIGIGPFITIPLLMSALNGPQSLLGWLVALMIAIPDGMIWSELGAAMPGSGGTYRYLREAYGRHTFGRLMAFLFIWQFIISGPLEIASAYIGFVNYLGYVWPNMGPTASAIITVSLGLLVLFLLYRRIGAIGKITVFLWVGTLITAAAVIGTGALHFDARVAFDFPPGAFDFSLGFFLGLGAATRVGVYDYLGYYDICYIGDEVKDPGRVIPRSILISVLAVALIYIAINLSLIGVVPWREFVPAEKHPNSDYIVSIFMEKTHGVTVAKAFTLLVLWTNLGSIFALLLGYSRIPYAAARDGGFFSVFGRLHPKHAFPHVSLLTMGLISIVCSFMSLGLVIDALIITRIIIQFIGQIGAVVLLRRYQPAMPRPYRIWLYPIPCFLALVGWVFVFVTTDVKVLALGVGSLLLGVGGFLAWSKATQRWPFAPAQVD